MRQRRPYTPQVLSHYHHRHNCRQHRALHKSGKSRDHRLFRLASCSAAKQSIRYSSPQETIPSLITCSFDSNIPRFSCHIPMASTISIGETPFPVISIPSVPSCRCSPRCETQSLVERLLRHGPLRPTVLLEWTRRRTYKHHSYHSNYCNARRMFRL